VDPVAAERSATNPRRVIRALEIYEATGKPMSELEGKNPPRYRTLELGLFMPRESLYRAIDDRVDDQIARGLEREVRTLLEAGIPRTNPAFSALGYRQLFPAIDGEISLSDAIQTIKHDTHRYVRHQETWLRKNPRIIWMDVSEAYWQEKAVATIESFLGHVARPALGADSPS
jgi:tRNA dimethylallyltransferase